MTSERKYIYGIIEEPESRPFGFPGVGDGAVYTINHQKLAAVVSDTEFDEIDPTRNNVRAHTVVQDELLKDYTLLPMGFGMIADSRDNVLKLLEKNYQNLTDALRQLAGMVEVELKVFWDQESMVKELQNGSEELAKLKAKLKAARSPVETQKLLIEAGQLVERIALDWKAKYADRVYTTLKALSLDSRLNSPLGVKNILNASFLIERARESDFQKDVHKLDAQYQGKVNFKYVGPLAPYNFVNVKLESIS
ncbi:MAG: GvpL/GvpF family gas vesicle protein [Chloroflexi bacterium]|nr:GvpL/GvpF family gas vesicle protein [Chloroflexota bacterium]